MLMVKCPQCGAKIEYETNEHRPFCSERCKLLDFGAWADEEYALGSESTELTEDDIVKIEKTLEDKNR